MVAHYYWIKKLAQIDEAHVYVLISKLYFPLNTDYCLENTCHSLRKSCNGASSVKCFKWFPSTTDHLLGWSLFSFLFQRLAHNILQLWSVQAKGLCDHKVLRLRCQPNSMVKAKMENQEASYIQYVVILWCTLPASNMDKVLSLIRACPKSIYVCITQEIGTW